MQLFGKLTLYKNADFRDKKHAIVMNQVTPVEIGESVCVEVDGIRMTNILTTIAQLAGWQNGTTGDSVCKVI